MKKILIAIFIISIFIFIGCSNEPKVMSRQEAEMHANLFLKKEYPAGRYNIISAVQKANNWEFMIMHDFYDPGKLLKFKGYLCIDGNGKTQVGLTADPFC
jgi:hypothetical protein